MTTFPLVEIHVAGSCSKQRGPGGWACRLVSGAHVREISGRLKETTLIRASLTALLKGVEALTKECQIEVYTNCKTIVTDINFLIDVERYGGRLCLRGKRDRTTELLEKAALVLRSHDLDVIVSLDGRVWSEHDQRVHNLARAEAMAAESLVIERKIHHDR